MHSFYIENAQVGQDFSLDREESRHAIRVLRLSEGDEVCALDGLGGRFSARIRDASPDHTVVAVVDALPSNEPDVRVTLYQGIPKADKLEWIVQKITELGACAMIPVAMERSVVKSSGKDSDKKRGRLDRIAREAAKQCRRACPARIYDAMRWDQAIDHLAGHDLILTPWEEARGATMQSERDLCPNAKDIAIVIGPEGGMSAGEAERLASCGAHLVTLGPRILRAETAAITSVALAMMLWGDL